MFSSCLWQCICILQDWNHTCHICQRQSLTASWRLNYYSYISPYWHIDIHISIHIIMDHDIMSKNMGCIGRKQLNIVWQSVWVAWLLPHFWSTAHHRPSMRNTWSEPDKCPLSPPYFVIYKRHFPTLQWTDEPTYLSHSCHSLLLTYALAIDHNLTSNHRTEMKQTLLEPPKQTQVTQSHVQYEIT